MERQRHRDIYVAYDRRSGIPWAASFDRDEIFDYAEDNNLTVLDVKYFPAKEKYSWE